VSSSSLEPVNFKAKTSEVTHEIIRESEYESRKSVLQRSLEKVIEQADLMEVQRHSPDRFNNV
jgi:hypothetical protein